MNNFNNFYLEILKSDEGLYKINANDGVFSSCGTFGNENEFREYCENRANEWLTSKLGNYNGWSYADRYAVAEKWLNAKDLYPGKYKYYFNLEDIYKLFRNAVAELAMDMGINNYTLNIQK